MVEDEGLFSAMEASLSSVDDVGASGIISLFPGAPLPAPPPPTAAAPAAFTTEEDAAEAAAETPPNDDETLTAPAPPAAVLASPGHAALVVVAAGAPVAVTTEEFEFKFADVEAEEKRSGWRTTSVPSKVRGSWMFNETSPDVIILVSTWFFLAAGLRNFAY